MDPVTRRQLLCLSAVLFAAPLAAAAQQPVRAHRIGLLWTTSGTGSTHLVEAFRQGLRDLGYVEGRNITIESRWAEGKMERLRDFVVELVGLKVDVIVAPTTPTALAARDATRRIPIVFVTAGDPVASGLVASVARPGGNVTGLSLLAPEITAKQLQLLKEVVPTAASVAILSNPAHAYTALLIKETEAAARVLGLRLQLLGVRGASELDRAFSAISGERPDALSVLSEPLLFFHRTRIVEFASQHRLPAIYPHREYAEAGGLMAYGADVRDNFRRAATYVDKLLKGARPADLPVEQPTKFELVINMKTARALGLTIPPALLLRADHVIE